MATHTWNFRVYLGRTYGKCPLSGITIAAYNTRTGSTLITSGTTNSSGSYSHSVTLGNGYTSPTLFYWRIHPSTDSFLRLYAGTNIAVAGSSSNCYSTPTANYNTSGVSIVSSSYNVSQATTCSINIYLYIVLNGAWTYNTKMITKGEIAACLPPGKTIFTSDYNACATKSDVSSYLSRSYFVNPNGVTNNVQSTNVAFKMTYLSGYTYFISGTSTVSMSQPKSMSWYSGSSAAQSQTITVTNAGSNFQLKCTLSSSTYFSISTSSTMSGTSRIYTVTVTPKSTNSTSSTRSTNLTFGITFPDAQNSTSTSYYYAGTTGGGTTVSLFQYGSGGGGASTTSLATIGEFDDM